MSQDQETKIVTDESVPPPEHHEVGLNDNDTILDDRGRRTFLKRAALGGGGVLRALCDDVFTGRTWYPVVHPAGVFAGIIFRAALLVPPVLSGRPVP